MATDATFPIIPRTVKTYKSERAARMAASKADKAYGLAMSNNGCEQRHSPLSTGDREALTQRVNEYLADTWRNLTRTLEAAEEQGFVVSSRWASFHSRGVDSLFE